MRFKFVSQLESNDCGPACLAMVASFHGYSVNLKKAKELCAVTRMGVSVKDILDGGRHLGMQSTGLKLFPAQLAEIPLPAILFWKQDHFVVLYKISMKRGNTLYHIADPGYGKIAIDEDLLSKEWLGNNAKGIALVFPKDESALLSEPANREQQKEKGFRAGTLYSELRNFVFKHKLKYILSISLLALGLLTNWAIPIFFRRIIDEGIVAKSLNVVILLLLAQFALFLGNSVSGFLSDLLLTRFNFNLAVMLKGNFLKKLIRLPVSYFDTRLNTDTLQRLSDLSKVQSFLTWKGISFVINVLNLIVFSAILLFMNQLIFSVYFVLSAISIFWIGYFLKRRATLEYSMFIRQSENSNNLYEFIMNMPEIKVNQAERTLIGRITALQKKLHELELDSLYLNMYQLSGANFILKIKELTAIAIAAYFIIHGQMSIGTLLSISYIMGQLSGPIINLITNIRDGQDASISNRRIEEVYTVPNEAEEQNLRTEPVNVEELALKDVSFKYPGSFNSFVLRNLTMTIPKNKITAIVGTSGSGKTTLMKLLLCYYPSNEGDIWLGKRRLSSVHPDNWRTNCGVVLQDGHIFAGTILFNVALCEPEEVDMPRFIEAINVACLAEMLEALPMGHSTKIGSIGMQLSGGQKQRVLIARAVYKNPQFLFFDEATSSLDANTERAIMDNLSHFFQGRTVVVVAHRLSTVKNADKIVVLEKGEIIEMGSHDELLKVKDKYFSLVKNQLELGA
ncbi:peptidase domain-containing ABC transporter [Mucilaginibacter sp. Mucisp86]|uniref:peptidase domain-containing ABC transporter n=1 Tax=Mucilaginibacter sp. Mucisp86 TaxID=3243060 RepID=UPI0039B4742B